MCPEVAYDDLRRRELDGCTHPLRIEPADEIHMSYKTFSVVKKLYDKLYRNLYDFLDFMVV